MIENPKIIEEAKTAIEQGKDFFETGESLIFFVAKSIEYKHQPGQMPSYFDFKGERWVVYVKADKPA